MIRPDDECERKEEDDDDDERKERKEKNENIFCLRSLEKAGCYLNQVLWSTFDSSSFFFQREREKKKLG